MLTADESDVLRRLEEWNKRVTALEEMFDKAGEVRSEHLADARQRYTDLKRDLEAEHKRMSKRGAELNTAEQACYAPTVHEAYVHLDAAINARPSAWLSSLYDARTDFEHMIWQLREAAQDVALEVGEALPASCPHCADEVRAEHRFSLRRGKSMSSPDQVTHWVSRCTGCARLYTYTPSTGVLQEHREPRS